ncbi:MAG: hypothetical protein ACI9NQ_001743 [Paracoccaceae bacterium]|jgi:hypothetical protein
MQEELANHEIYERNETVEGAWVGDFANHESAQIHTNLWGIQTLGSNKQLGPFTSI